MPRYLGISSLSIAFPLGWFQRLAKYPERPLGQNNSPIAAREQKRSDVRGPHLADCPAIIRPNSREGARLFPFWAATISKTERNLHSEGDGVLSIHA